MIIIAIGKIEMNQGVILTPCFYLIQNLRHAMTEEIV